MLRYLAAIMLLIAIPAGAAFAQQNSGDDVPPGTDEDESADEDA